MTEIRGLLFDKDGTLFDFHRTWTPIMAEVAEEIAGAPMVPRLLGAIGYREESGRFGAGSIGAAGNTFELADTWLALLGGGDREAMVEKLDGYFARLGPLRSVPVTDLAVFFGGLKQRGYTLGIATNDVEASALGTIERFGLQEAIDFAVGYDSGHGAKPGPGMALAFCAAVGLRPSEIAVIGDNAHDLDMGRSAGAGLLVGVLTGASERDDLAPLADHVIENIEMLPALLGN
ncbi:HAD family hydrolase [Parvibaculum sp.]|uniref:HAD family hydrolase n=1 Tax=Parvibaculum sp. TaxID=2024848 RepID=UPI002FDAAA3A